MSSLPSPANLSLGAGPSPALPAEVTACLPADRTFDCFAGFYASEGEWQLAARELRLAHSLLPSQLVLLSPTDAAPALFSRLARQWLVPADTLEQGWSSDRWLLGGLGALCGSIVAMALLMLDINTGLLQALDLHLPLLLLAVVSGGLIGSKLASHRRSRAPVRGFEDRVRHALGLGQWVLVVHAVPYTRQVNVVKAVCNRSVNWCAAVRPLPLI